MNTRIDGFYKNLNDIGKRLSWAREKAGLTRNELASLIPMPPVSLFNRENGRRAVSVEEYAEIAAVLDFHWQKKYKTSFPIFEGKELKRITAPWLMFGQDKTLEALNAAIEYYENDRRQKQTEYAMELIALKDKIANLVDEKERLKNTAS